MNRIEKTEPKAVEHKSKQAPKAGDLTLSFEVDQTPQQVFDAVNDVRGWWMGTIEGVTDAQGAEFTYRYQSAHRSTQKITELVPGKRVVWQVTESRLGFVKDQAEWDGTKMIFDIRKQGDKTELTFTHVGLVPAIECYGQCSGAWGFLIKECLHALITSGRRVAKPSEA